MAYPYWITEAGSLGIIEELEFYQLQMEARDPDLSEDNVGLQYTVLAGELPPGIILTLSGIIEGNPLPAFALKGIPLEVKENITSEFVVRVTDQEGLIADRTFTLTVAGPDDPDWISNGILFESTDGVAVSHQIVAVDTDGDPLTFTLISGQLPPGLELDANGLISGRIGKVNETKDWDFVVSLTDNNVVIEREFYIRVYGVGNFTCDTEIDDFGERISVDSDEGLWSSDRYYVHRPYMFKTYSQSEIRHDNYYLERFYGRTVEVGTYVDFELSGVLPNDLEFNGTYDTSALDTYASCLVYGNITKTLATIRDYRFQLRPRLTHETPIGEYAGLTKTVILTGDWQEYTLPVRGELNIEVVWSNS
jgi:hypothetical protein